MKKEYLMNEKEVKESIDFSIEDIDTAPSSAGGFFFFFYFSA